MLRPTEPLEEATLSYKSIDTQRSTYVILREKLFTFSRYGGGIRYEVFFVAIFLCIIWQGSLGANSSVLICFTFVVEKPSRPKRRPL